MRKIMFGLLFVAIMATAEGDGETEPLGPFPVTESPAGDFPVGHWECWSEQSDFAKTATSNNPFLPRRCSLALFMSATVAELLPDGYGWMLAIQTDGSFAEASDNDFDPDTAFRIEGADRLYSRAGEIRWSFDRPGQWKSCNDARADGCLTIQTTRNDRYAVTVQSDDVMRLDDTYYGTLRLLFRTGSEASRTMVEFRDCVLQNRAGISLTCSSAGPRYRDNAMDMKQLFGSIGLIVLFIVTCSCLHDSLAESQLTDVLT